VHDHDNDDEDALIAVAIEEDEKLVREKKRADAQTEHRISAGVAEALAKLRENG
jgi:DNA excision repair protein ERCC-1